MSESVNWKFTHEVLKFPGSGSLIPAKDLEQLFYNNIRCKTIKMCMESLM